MVNSMLEFFDTVTGLAIASDAIPKPMKDDLLTGNSSVKLIVPLLEELFEIIRRHKRLNPFDHRGDYGKLLMLLQDVQKPSIKQQLGINSSLVIPCQTVRSALESIECLDLLDDPDLLGKYLRVKGPTKKEGMNLLINRYGGDDPSKRAVVERCLYSADDVRQLTLSSIGPLTELFTYVKEEFEPMAPGSVYNISIRSGSGGALFTHNHLTHCYYVEESLILWETVQRRILSLWEAAEDDMLVDSNGSYEFVNTGQGFHRVCRAPKSYNAMSGCVRFAHDLMGGWIGIKVIHLGDRDVPNPLVFIDKYTMIPRIVQPIVTTLHQLRHIFGDDGTKSQEESPTNDERAEAKPGEEIHYPGLRSLLKAKYGSYEELRMLILCDFFKHAFDGSGSDGGSCIDGRLTSAWNWCHQLSKKPYYDAFVLTGFTGFD